MHIVAPLYLANKVVTTDLPAFIMGIVNITNDSFWSESRKSLENVESVVMNMVENGADIIDIGGESSRPGSEYISEEEEIKRIIPVISAIRKHTECPISVDTRKYNVMKAALDEGADILNDISALEDDSSLGFLVSKTKIPVILMHKRGIPVIMQENTKYENICDDVTSYLIKRIEYAVSCGISLNKIILDAGIGFGKDLEGNISLIKNSNLILGKIKEVFNCNEINHILMALSRKRVIGDMTGEEVDERLSGTLAANLLSVQNGATMLRVHDVKETRDMLRVYRSLS